MASFRACDGSNGMNCNPRMFNETPTTSAKFPFFSRENKHLICPAATKNPPSNNITCWSAKTRYLSPLPLYRGGLGYFLGN